VPHPDGGLVRGDLRALGGRIFTGHGFDTCVAPPARTMRAWRRSSPYGAVGVYIGGRARGCPGQPHLTRSWTSEVHGMGWEFLPIYVGSQAPCVSSERKRRFAMSRTHPTRQGTAEGHDAVARARALGMGPSSAIYLDMEAYNERNTRCAATTLKFVRAWNRALREEGYISGFYSSAGSGITHMERVRRAGSGDLPQALWFAHWGVPASVHSERRIGRHAWQPHRRIHQYAGNVTRTYGGRRLNIDRNMVDAPVANLGW
jgi:hypothetical protein